MKRFLPAFAAVAVVCSTLASAGLSHASTMSIYASGFNVDEVFGVGDDPTNAGNDAVTGDVDGSNSYWTGAGYTDGTTTVTQGLPTGPFLSATGSGVTYQLQSFSANNALRGNGTVNVEPGEYSVLEILATTGGGSSASNITLHFSDSSTDTITGAVVAPDWGNDGAVAVSAQRTRPGPLTGSITSGTWNMFESLVDLSPTDEAKTLTSITFTNPDGGVANIYAIDGTTAVPEPCSIVLLGIGAISGLGFVVPRRGKV